MKTNPRPVSVAQTYTSDAVVDVSDVVCVSLVAHKPLHQSVEHHRHPAAAVCRQPLLQELHKPGDTDTEDWIHGSVIKASTA